MGRVYDLKNEFIYTLLKIIAMCGESEKQVWRASGISRKNAFKHVGSLTEEKTWKFEETEKYRNMNILQVRGEGHEQTLAFSKEALKLGILEDLDVQDYVSLYSRVAMEHPAAYRTRNRKMSGLLVGLYYAGVNVLYDQKPVPGIDLNRNKRFITPTSAYFYTLKEIREDDKVQGKASDIAYGQSLGLLVHPTGNYAVYGQERKKNKINLKSEKRTKRLYERFLMRHSRDGKKEDVSFALWTESGYVPVKRHLKNSNEDYIYGKIYQKDLFITHENLKYVLPTIGRESRYITLLDGKMITLTGNNARIADWRGGIGGDQIYFNGTTCDMAKIKRFKSYCKRNSKCYILCLPVQKEFYKKEFSETANIICI